MPLFRGPDGRIVVEDEAHTGQLIAGGYTPINIAQGSEGTASERPEDTGVTGSLGALATGALSGATLGGSDWALKGLLDKGDFKTVAAQREQHPIAGAIGQVGGAIAPALITGGAVTPAGALGRIAAEGIEAGRATGGALGLAQQLAFGGAEGALQNAGAYLSDVALGDRDLTAEGINGALGTGLLFGAAGIPVSHGIEAGTIAARRLFARYAQGGEQAARDAAAAWTTEAQKGLEAFDQTAELAKARLAEAQAAREQAGLQKLRTGAELADARAFTPPSEFPGAGGSGAAVPGIAGDAAAGGATSVVPPGEPPEVAVARMLRDRAQTMGGAPITPEEVAALEQRIGRRVYSSGPAAEQSPIDALAAIPGAKRYGPDTLGRIPVTADEAELGAKLSEYQAAKQAFADLHAKVDPELEAILRGVQPDDLVRTAVPVGEFGAPGARGIKSPAELEQLAAGTGREEAAAAAAPAESTRVLRGGAKGTPTEGRTLGEIAAEQAPIPVAAAEPPIERMSEAQIDALQKRLDDEFAKHDPSSREYVELSKQWDRAVARRQALKDGISEEWKSRIAGPAPLSEDEFDAVSAPWRKALAPESADAMQRYARNGLYARINGTLRSGKDLSPELSKIADDVERGVESARAPREMTVFRGVNGVRSTNQWNAAKVGDVIVDPAFGSTSTMEHVGAGYSKGFGVRPGVELRVTIPEGFPAAPIPSDLFGSEREILLPRNTRYSVTAIEERPGGKVIHVAASREGMRHAAVAGESDLEALLRGTASALDRGESFTKLGEAPAAEYRAAKAARSADAAAHFRGKAIAENYAGSDMAAAERAAQPAPTPGRLREGLPERARIAGRYSNPEPGGHPLAVKELEVAHDAALERAATAADPAERASAETEAKAIEKQITAVGARPGAVEDVAALAPAITRIEKAAAELTEALGDAAPAAAREHAAAFRAAEDEASRKTSARIGQAADDAAAARAAAQNRDPLAPAGRESDDLLLGPSRKEQRINAAKKANREAQAAYAKARVSEAEAKVGAKQAAGAAAKARAELGPPPEPGAPAAGHGFAQRVAHGVHIAGYAAELGSDLGIPGIPRPHDIPVIGPLLSAYLKYRALRAAAGRFVGRVPATADARAAALAAKARDGIARAVDRSLGLVERNTNTIRAALTIGTIKATDALGKRLFDDGHPDAPAGASLPQQAAVRMREVAAVATNPSLISAAVRAQTSSITDPDLIDALANHLTVMFQHLNDTAPKGPPPNPFTGKTWAPSPADALQWGQRVAVARDPQVAFDMLEAGTLSPAAADTMRTVYQKLFAEAQDRVIQRAGDLKHPVPYRQLVQNSLLFGAALHPSMEPEHAAVLAGAHAPAAPAQPGPGAGPQPTPSIANPTNLSKLYDSGADRAGRN